MRVFFRCKLERNLAFTCLLILVTVPKASLRTSRYTILCVTPNQCFSNHLVHQLGNSRQRSIVFRNWAALEQVSISSSSHLTFFERTHLLRRGKCNQHDHNEVKLVTLIFLSLTFPSVKDVNTTPGGTFPWSRFWNNWTKTRQLFGCFSIPVFLHRWSAGPCNNFVHPIKMNNYAYRVHPDPASRSGHLHCPLFSALHQFVATSVFFNECICIRFILHNGLWFQIFFGLFWFRIRTWIDSSKLRTTNTSSSGPKDDGCLCFRTLYNYVWRYGWNIDRVTRTLGILQKP